MKQIIKFFKKLFHTEYRIALWGNDGSLSNLSAPSVNKILTQMEVLSKEKPHLAISQWSLYKKGPLCLPERHIASNKVKHKKH